MKKSLLTTLALASACISFAQNGLTVLPLGPTADEWGMQGLAISDNGKYVCGATGDMSGFLTEVATGTTLVDAPMDDYGCEFRGVSNEGLAVGFNIMARTLDMNGEAVSYGTNTMFEDVTPDGKIISGSVSDDAGFFTHAAVWKDGEMTQLPEPSNGWCGFETNGTSAKHLNGDGGIICGQITDNFSTMPVLLWRLNIDSLTWSPDPSIVRKYFEGTSEYEDETKEEVGTKPYIQFQATGISSDSHYLALTVAPLDGDISLPARYNLVTDELEVAEVEASDDPLSAATYATGGIANDGTIVGYVTQGFMVRQGFIWKPGEKSPQLIADAFDKCGTMFSNMDAAGQHVVTDITPDGRYILGFGVDAEQNSQAILTYVLDTETYDPNDTSAISAVNAGAKSGSKAVFNLNGVKLPHALRGINIVRNEDGKMQKVVKK